MFYLITGGAGFLGSALANRLVENGHDVRVIDDLSSGDEKRLSPRVSFARGDVNDVPQLWTLLQGVECVYHLAARVRVPESLQYPRDYNAVNVGGTVSVLEAMRDVGVQRVVLASSGAVYGEQMVHPVHEGLPPDPRSPYAVSKLAAEHYVRTIGALWGIETVSLRIFNAYGPGQQLPAAFPPVVPNFLQRALTGGSLIAHGDGSAVRDYVYIEDVVDALIAASTAPEVDRLVINVGSGIGTSVRDLIALIGKVVGKELRPLYANKISGGVSELCADLTLARQKLGYAPKVMLQDGLRRTFELDERFNKKA